MIPAWSALTPAGAILGILVGALLVRRARSHLVQALGVAMIAGAAWLLARSHLPGDLPAESAAGVGAAGGSESGSVFAVASVLIPVAVAVAGFVLSSRLDRA